MQTPNAHHEFLKNAFLDKVKDYSISNKELIAYMRYIKYDIFNGNIENFKKFLFPLINCNTFWIDRSAGIVSIILSSTYKKPRKQFDRVG